MERSHFDRGAMGCRPMGKATGRSGFTLRFSECIPKVTQYPPSRENEELDRGGGPGLGLDPLPLP